MALTINGTSGLVLESVGSRITGDFSNTNVFSRTMFQTRIADGNTSVYAIPNGTGTAAAMGVLSSSTENYTRLFIQASTTNTYISATKGGTASYPPLIFGTGNAERMRIDASGNFGVGTTSPLAKTNIYDISSNYPLFVQGGNAGAAGAGGSIAFATAEGSAIAGPSTAAAAIRSLNLYAGESNGEEGSLVFYTNKRTGSNTYTGLTERMRIDSSGNVTAAGNVTAYSDIKLKTDIATIDNALDKVLKMRGVIYTRIDTGLKGTGVIAQEIKEVLPEVVIEGETLSVAYGNIVGVLIEAIKELKAEIEQLKGK
jgi:hypothetical protein